MAASAQLKSRFTEAPPRELDRLFEVCFSALAAVGFVALGLSGAVDAYSATAGALAVLLRVLRAFGKLRYQVSRDWAAIPAVGLVLFYPLDALWIAGGFMESTVRLLVLFLALKLLIAEKPRDYVYAGLLSFFQLLTASMYLEGLAYLVVLALFLGLGATAYMANQLSKGWRESPRVVAPADVRTGLPRRLLRLGTGLSTGVLLAAAVLFLALPRPQASTGGWVDDGTTVGFSPEVNLGKTGALTEDPTPVMRVESLDGGPLLGRYWRAVTLFHFDGMRWTAPGVRSRPLNGAGGGVWPGHGRRIGEGFRLKYRVRLEPLPTDALFLAGKPEQIRGSFTGLHVSDVDTIQVAELQPGPVVYEATAWLPDRRTLQPTDVVELFSERFQGRYLQLPDYDARIPELIDELTVGATAPLRKAEALETHFRTEYGYTLELPSQERADPLAHFLFDRREGHCEYFATAMALMLRVEGIPSRIVNGFAGGVRNPLSGGYLLRSSDAHSWVEAYIPGYGWLEFDPTPPAPPSALGPWAADVQNWWESAQATWAEWVVGYDALRQVELAKSFRDWARDGLLWVLGAVDSVATAAASASGLSWMADGVAYLFWLLPFGLALAAWRSRKWWRGLRRRRRVKSGRGEVGDVRALYEQALRVLARRGFERDEAQTAEEFERSVQKGRRGTYWRGSRRLTTRLGSAEMPQRRGDCRVSSRRSNAYASRVIRTFLLFFVAVTAASATDVALVDATIVDGTGGAPYVGTLLVSDDRIQAVGPEVSVPATYRVIDARDKTVTPGLFDLHAHLTYSAVSGLTGDWPKNLAAYLYSGVTSAVEFGSYPEQFEPMRKLLTDGTVLGPRIHFAVRIAPPYGHGMEGGRGDYFSRELFSAKGAERVVAALEEFRPDALKLFTDGWRYGYAEPMASMPEDVIAAAVKAAHERGWEVLTHTVTVEGAMDAAGGGVDVLDHGISDGEAPRALIDLIVENGVTYAPTHAVYHPKGRDILDAMLAAVVPPDSRAGVKPPLTPPTDRTKLVRGYRDPESARASRWTNLVANTAKLNAAGVAIGAGTDAGVTNTWHGWSLLRELQLMVHAGMTPLEALTAATGTSARALNVDDERGTLEKGKLADLVLFDGRPDREIADVLKIARVFKGGEELDRKRLAAFIAEPGMTKLPATVPGPFLDDFEAPGRRSSLGTNWVNSTDGGLDHATARFTRIWRREADRAMAVQAEMSLEDVSWSSVELPLTPGSVTPADLSRYRALKFDVRGDGAYRLELERMRDRNYREEDAYPHAVFEAGAKWRTVSVALKDLQVKEAGLEDVVLVRFRFDGAPGETRWLELDDLRLVR